MEQIGIQAGEAADKAETACFTGHRSIAWGQMEALALKLDETIAGLAARGVTAFLNGGTCGFDQLAALAVLKAREQNGDIRLIMVLPCLNQDEGWSETDKKTYRRILGGADHITYASDQPYAEGCIAERDRLLIGRSSVCVAYMEQDQAETGRAVRLACDHGLTVINLAVE